MCNKFSPFFPSVATLFLAIFSFSCEKSNPVSNGKLQLSASENPVTVAVNWQKHITISGGQGSCYVKSVSDSSIINAFIDAFTYPYGRSLSLVGKAIGNATIVVQDSAQTAEIDISVNVSTMAASPSNVIVQVQRSQYVSLQGGTYPYAIDQPANSVLANANISGNSVDIEGVAPGSTTLVVRDNANPPNKVTISITVTPKPVLTTPGKISFSSGAGDFSANGILQGEILGDSLANFTTLLSNSEGAGGTVLILSPEENLVEIIGYKKQSQNTVDLAAIVFVKSNLSQGVLTIHSSQVFYGPDTALVAFALGADLNSQTPDTYLMFSGTLRLSALSDQKATGTFSGEAILTRNDLPAAGNSIAVTNGTFDVPLLQDNLGLTSPNLEQQRIISFVEKNLENNLVKIQFTRKK